MDGKITHNAQCYKSHALTKAIGLIIDIESFEQKCVILKSLLKSYQQKKMVTIGIDQ